LSLAAAIASCASGEGAPGSAPVTMATVPTDSRYISGGDALVAVTLQGGLGPGSISFTLNGDDVTGAFRAAPPDWLDRPGPALLGLLTGLRDGENQLEAIVDGSTAVALT